MKTKRTYIDSVHFAGRIWVILALLVMVMVPVSISVFYNAWPALGVFLVAMLGIAPTFWTVAVIEVFTYIPMLGAGGSYLGFVTGNMTNLKVPCAVNALNAAKAEPNTEAGEVITTIAVAVSSIVTTAIITLGVLLLVQIRPLLEAPVLAPAFANILPSLFGALAVVLIGRNWKVALPPLIVMIVLFFFIPALAGAVGVLVPVGVLIAVGAARLMYKKGWL
ncbi:MAG: hypothetical protein FWC72_04925 [Oscillospiraceae bacterium]|nr:hypothetical protein [Oscillospiraceae bacterium]